MFTTSVTIDQAIEAVASFLQPFSPSAEIVQAQVDRVSMPPDPCIVLTPIVRSNLATPSFVGNGTDMNTISTPARLDIQVDFYGDSSGDVAAAVSAAAKTEYSTLQFPDWLTPLYCSDALQYPLITGEEQWEQRWALTLSLQINVSIDTPQQFADELIVTLNQG